MPPSKAFENYIEDFVSKAEMLRLTEELEANVGGKAESDAPSEDMRQVRDELEVTKERLATRCEEVSRKGKL